MLCDDLSIMPNALEVGALVYHILLWEHWKLAWCLVD